MNFSGYGIEMMNSAELKIRFSPPTLKCQVLFIFQIACVFPSALRNYSSSGPHLSPELQQWSLSGLPSYHLYLTP